MADPRCVKCGMQHSSKDCNIERPLFRCVLCEGNHPASYKGCIAHKERAKKITNKLPHVKPQRPQKESKKVVNELTYAAISKPKKPDPDNTKTIATPNMTDCNNVAIEQKQAQPPAEENVTEVISPSIPPKQEAPKPPRPAKTRGNSDKVPTHQPDRSENLGQTTLNNGSWNDALVQIIRIFNPKFTWEGFLPKLMPIIVGFMTNPQSIPDLLNVILDCIRTTNND
ncbi:hypothetical protein AAG570_009571 [Ranatra chinensis]|uniref:Uncharacterized protein n=1 Tax=Ranatra chinensis TaxID=642074 RepID=A0ABD0YPQ2_9HEMI